MTNSLCRQCQGACCKSNPGGTVPRDWGSDARTIRANLTRALETGQWVVAFTPDRSWYVQPARGRGACVFLGPTGCTLTESARPTGCRLLIPSTNFPQGCHYPEGVSYESLTDSWRPYRKMLEEILDETAILEWMR